MKRNRNDGLTLPHFPKKQSRHCVVKCSYCTAFFLQTAPRVIQLENNSAFYHSTQPFAIFTLGKIVRLEIFSYLNYSYVKLDERRVEWKRLSLAITPACSQDTFFLFFRVKLLNKITLKGRFGFALKCTVLSGSRIIY